MNGIFTAGTEGPYKFEHRVSENRNDFLINVLNYIPSCYQSLDHAMWPNQTELGLTLSALCIPQEDLNLRTEQLTKMWSSVIHVPIGHNNCRRLDILPNIRLLVFKSSEPVFIENSKTATLRFKLCELIAALIFRFQLTLYRTRYVAELYELHLPGKVSTLVHLFRCVTF